jgi:CxxC-x17-CxxC domain-containing protein
MKNFNKSGGGYKGPTKGAFGRPGYQKKEWSGEKREVVMHQATCTNCNKSCEVPFKPTGDKPVLCRDCFVPKKDFAGMRGDRPSFNSYKTPMPSGSSDDTKRAIQDLSKKMDRLIEAVEKLAK